MNFLLKHKDTLKTISLHSNDELKNNDVLEQLTELTVLGVGDTNITDFSFIGKLPNLTNGSLRNSEWGYAHNGVDYWTNTCYGVFEAIECERKADYDAVTYSIKNEVKDESGNLVAPAPSEDYTYNEATGEIDVVLDKGKTTEVLINYYLDMKTVKGQQLLARSYMCYKIERNNELKFIQQPKSKNVEEGAEVQMYSFVTGNGAISYQWYKDGKPIDGATSSVYCITNASEADAGEYYVVAKDEYYTITSDKVSVTVKEKVTEAPSTEAPSTGSTTDVTPSTEAPTTENTTEAPTNKPPVDGPATGDGPMPAVFVMMLLAGMASLGLAKLRKKNI